jgi:hypothetical protein
MSGDPLFEEVFMENAAWSELMRTVGPIGKFKPCAYYIPELSLVIVATKDCSYTVQWINNWSEVHWDNYRPWYAPWKKCVGFSVYCPRELGFLGEVPVATVLDRVLEKDPTALGTQRRRFYQLARNLMVNISYEAIR